MTLKMYYLDLRNGQICEEGHQLHVPKRCQYVFTTYKAAPMYWYSGIGEAKLNISEKSWEIYVYNDLAAFTKKGLTKGKPEPLLVPIPKNYWNNLLLKHVQTLLAK